MNKYYFFLVFAVGFCNGCAQNVIENTMQCPSNDVLNTLKSEIKKIDANVEKDISTRKLLIDMYIKDSINNASHFDGTKIMNERKLKILLSDISNEFKNEIGILNSTLNNPSPNLYKSFYLNVSATLTQIDSVKILPLAKRSSFNRYITESLLKNLKSLLNLNPYKKFVCPETIIINRDSFFYTSRDETFKFGIPNDWQKEAPKSPSGSIQTTANDYVKKKLQNKGEIIFNIEMNFLGGRGEKYNGYFMNSPWFWVSKTTDLKYFDKAKKKASSFKFSNEFESRILNATLKDPIIWNENNMIFQTYTPKLPPMKSIKLPLTKFMEVLWMKNNKVVVFRFASHPPDFTCDLKYFKAIINSIQEL